MMELTMDSRCSQRFSLKNVKVVLMLARKRGVPVGHGFIPRPIYRQTSMIIQTFSDIPQDMISPTQSMKKLGGGFIFSRLRGHFTYFSQTLSYNITYYRARLRKPTLYNILQTLSVLYRSFDEMNFLGKFINFHVTATKICRQCFATIKNQTSTTFAM